MASLDNLKDDQESFMNSGMFAQSLTGNPYSCVALDIWIESTMNKGSKLKNGWLAILSNEKQLLTNTLNVNNINRLRNTVHKHAGRKRQKGKKHADCYKPRLIADEKAVQDMSACLNEFQCDPFDLSDTTLRSLQSGLCATDELLRDAVSAKIDGEHMVGVFMDERVFSKAKSLNDRVPRSNRLNFENQDRKPISGTTGKEKAQEMERDALATVLELVDKSGALDLKDVLQHRVTQECLPIFNVNGTMRKTQKSKLMQSMHIDVCPIPCTYTAIIDMGHIWRLSSPSKEDREKTDGTKFTWGDFAEKLISLMLSRHANAERIICVNDNYSQTSSIKDSERMLRQSKKQVPNVYMKAEHQFPNAMDFNEILSKPKNKSRLQGFLKTQLQKTADATDTEIVYIVVGESSNNLSTHDSEDHLMCKHAEADTAMFTVYSALRQSGYRESVVIDTEDTDNYVQAAYVANKVEGSLFLKQKNRIIDAQSLFQEDMIDCIIPLHVLTGCDHNSGFYGIGKTKVAERLKKSPDLRQLLLSCGNNLQLADEDVDNLVKFVIKCVYSDGKSVTIAEARSSKWKLQKKKSLVRTLPDMDSLLHHLKRANYLSYIQKNFCLMDHPSPLGNGWHMENELCLPSRSTLPPLPPQVLIAPHSGDDHPPVVERDDDTTSSMGDDSDDESYVFDQSNDEDDDGSDDDGCDILYDESST